MVAGAALRLAFLVTPLFGWMVFSSMNAAGTRRGVPRPPATAIGILGFIVAGATKLIALVVMLWWLTQPTQPQDNAVGPVPASAGRRD